MMVDVAFPCLNEEATIGELLLATEAWRARSGIRRTIVLDSNSTDRTSEVARLHGAEVVHAHLIATEAGPVLGKGDAVWRLAKALVDDPPDVLVLLDGDIRLEDPEMLDNLLLPFDQPEVHLVKAEFIRQPGLAMASPLPGGRVSDLVARPLLRTVDSKLATLSQPLSGQAAYRFTSLTRIPTCTHYGLEIGHLLEIWQRHGRISITEGSIGELSHREKTDASLVEVASDVAEAFLSSVHGFSAFRRLEVRPPVADLVTVREVTIESQPR